MKIKVLHLITRLVVGGAQDNTLLTVELHDRDRYIVHLASNPAGEWLDRAKACSDQFSPIDTLINPINPVKDLRALWHMVRLMRREKFDLIHTHSSKAGILGRIAAFITTTPVVHTIHGFPFHDFMPQWKQNLFIWLERQAARYTKFLITVSELNRNQAIALGIITQENSRTIYSGIDFRRLAALKPEHSQLRQSLGFKAPTQIITMVGRLEPQKAPQYLIQAFAEVVKTCPDTVLLLVGDGELKPELLTQVETLGLQHQVKFLGSREDVLDILAISDIFALSSLWEGLGRAMTEAMLMGKAVVVPNIYGIPEIVHHQETGLLFPSQDWQQLAHHLIFLLRHPLERDRLGHNAQQLTQQLFDGKEMVKAIEQVYEEVLRP
jgi:glycosyltransferase involved in cell wall biosynthesis